MKHIHLRLRLFSVSRGWLLIVLSATIISCGGGTSISRLIPAHTARYWAAVSAPIVLSDGGTMIVNGDLLWRYNAQGGLLSETVLTTNKPQEAHPRDSRLYSNAVGDLYLTLYGNEVRRVDEQGTTIWSRDIDLYSIHEQIPTDEGLAIFHWDEGAPTFSMLDREGNMAWSSDYFPENWMSYCGVDDERIYLTSGMELIAISAAEGFLWSQDVRNPPGVIRFSGASSNRITVIVYDKLYCFDADGTKLWEVGAPSGYSVFRAGMHMSDDLIYAWLSQGHPSRSGILVLDGDGNTITQLDDCSLGITAPLDADRFASIFKEGNNSFFGVYDADDCSLQWKFPLSGSDNNGIPHENEIVSYYSWGSIAALASNDLLYSSPEGVLYEWDQNGNLLREIASKSFIDIWVEAYTAF